MIQAVDTGVLLRSSINWTVLKRLALTTAVKG